MTIELHGIVLHGFHGVLEEERRDGQRFLVDVELDLEHDGAAASDRIEDAVDYRGSSRASAGLGGHAYHLLEAFAAAIADALLAELPGDRRPGAGAQARRRARAAGRVRRRLGRATARLYESR